MSVSVLSGRRSSINIVHDILNLCSQGEINKTAIMYRCNLSFYQLERYLSLLTEQRLIERNDERRFQITVRGQKTLEKISEVTRSLREVSLDLDPVIGLESAFSAAD
ncbi:MAG: hypothetical protein O3A47_07120 [Chloroflexi bacterium]|nr:hypothetical protein [Chloroflexota bacterium]